ncbi:MAG TPA: FAD-dependent monooxygenase [Flavilitoribacter sp.]|nr:FAD-dependent monooxygenase [Flavilitoribacter sp.]
MEKTIAITGAGIAGLATAIGLRKLGYQPVIFEAAPAIKPLGAGLTLAANALKSLEKIGIREQTVAAGQMIDELKILDGKGKLVSHVHKPGNPDLDILAIHRADLHQVLLDQLDPGSLCLGQQVTGVKNTGRKAILEFANGSEFAADRVLAADGIHSPIRRSLLPDVQPRYAGYTCWRAISEAGDLEVKAATETWSPEGRFGIVPLTGNRIYWFAVVNAPEQDPDRRNWTVHSVLGHFSRFHDPIPAVIRRTPTDQLIHSDICDLSPLSGYRFDRVLLMGDAAHATTPNMGQGACQALQDAAVLKDILEKDPDWDAAFVQFEKRRLAKASQVVNTSRMMGRIAQMENPLLTGVRNRIFRLMPENAGQKRLKTLLSTDF